MKKIKKKKLSLFTNIIFSLITLGALTITIVVILINYSLKNQVELLSQKNDELTELSATNIYSESDLLSMINEASEDIGENAKLELLNDMKERLSSGDSAYNVFRDIFKDDLIVSAKEGYVFYPITDEYKHNNYVKDNFIFNEDTKEMTYSDSNGLKSHLGIDVSKHNGNINWEKVKNEGVEFAFIRVGYRGSTEGALTLDDTFKKNIEGALSNGIEVGVYFFTQAINEKEAIEEADFLLNAIEPYNVTLPVVWDIEDLDGRAQKLDATTRTDACIAFLDRVEGAGYDSMIYGNLKSMLYMLDTKRIEGYKKWFAYYHYPAYYPYEYDIWQYASDGTIDGISGEVDLNIWIK